MHPIEIGIRVLHGRKIPQTSQSNQHGSKNSPPDLSASAARKLCCKSLICLFSTTRSVLGYNTIHFKRPIKRDLCKGNVTFGVKAKLYHVPWGLPRPKPFSERERRSLVRFVASVCQLKSFVLEARAAESERLCAGRILFICSMWGCVLPVNAPNDDLMFFVCALQPINHCVRKFILPKESIPV